VPSCYGPLELAPRGKTWLLALLATAACGGNEFTSGATGGAGGSGGAGKGGGGGAQNGGSAGKSSGGSSGSAQGGSSGNGGGGSGSGGSPPTCICEPGEYCQVTTNTCRLCSDFSRLAFAAPEKIATISSSTAGQQRFPRVGASETELFYRAGPSGDEKIWQTPDYTAGYGTVASEGGQIDSGALFLGVGAEPNLIFDRVETQTTRRVVTATWNGTLSNMQLAPVPLNPDSGASSDYSIAVAGSPGGNASRAFWMSTRFGAGPSLVTAELTAADAEVVSLMIPTPGGLTCSRSGADATPWVTPNGDFMLFRAFPMDDNCQPTDGDATDLYAAILVPGTGQPPPATTAIPLADVNRSTGSSSETDPSLSADLCALYYASDSGEGVYEFDIFRAVRH
jgi:hypothetical protein